jgi:hypothetical protein
MNCRKFIAGSVSVLALSRLSFAKTKEFDCDICIVGGVAAAMSALAQLEVSQRSWPPLVVSVRSLMSNRMIVKYGDYALQF